MFIPLHDANALRHIRLQYVTIGLIIANVLVHLLTVAGTPQQVSAAQLEFGFTPALFTDLRQLAPGLLQVPDSVTLVSYAFFHIDWLHLGGNMLFLWVFGDNVEDAMGHVRFLVFYLLCAAGAALMHLAVDPGSDLPLIGASGAIAGVLAAYLVLHPKVRVWILAFGRIPLRVPAWMALAAWIGFQIFMLVSTPQDAISWAAHVGGILTGLVLVVPFRRRGVPLLDREIQTPRAVRTGQNVNAEPPPLPRARWGRGD